MITLKNMETSEESLLDIDGSYGEGGGQILRTALAFSAILKKSFRIHHIRSKRRNPGLRPQHLKGVEALAQITKAMVRGAEMGSETVSFFPGDIHPGDYQFQIGHGKGSAGSVTLLLQTLLLPLSLSQERSTLILSGGTHVRWSPPFHYLSEVLYPTLRSMGIHVEASMERWGWYPKGGGIVRAEVLPASEWKPISLVERGSLKKIHGLSATSHLPRHVGERQKDYAVKRIEKEMEMDAEIEVLDHVPASGPGSFIFLVAESEGALAGFSSLGRKGKRAEEVAEEAVDSLKNYIESEACIDPHLADQLVPFMALSRGHSSFITNQITEHLLTNLWVIHRFFEIKISISGEKGRKGRVDFFNG
ncbi:MAG: RNA 3'-terminal phosphate cyclase [Thermodesulfobacteriota bacterium]